MSAHCVPCGRSFKGHGDLDQHIQHSFAHKKPTQRPSQAQSSLQVKPRPVKLKQQEQKSPSQVNPAELQQVLGSGYRTYATDQLKQGEPPNAIASSSYTPQMTKPAVKSSPQDVKSPWSVIPESEYMAVLKALSTHCHSPGELKKNGYIIHLYNPLDYVNSRKCKRCNSKEMNSYNTECTFHPYKRNKWNAETPYKCCNTESSGCMTSPTHEFQLSLRAISHKDFLQTPAAAAGETKFRAVTFDCEMAGIAGGTGEVILLFVTDCITGALVLNRFVCPRETITQMRTSIHGISKSTLDDTISQGQALSGWEGARSELWKYIDDNTILVGHALQHDLDVLRIIHPRVVDSGILSRNAVGIGHTHWGLQTLCSELLNLEIRKNKGGIHDCLEDVLGTREVVLFCTQNKEALQSWAGAKKREEIRLEKEREIARQEKKNQQVRQTEVKVGG